MKLNGLPGEETHLSFKLSDGSGWLTTHRLVLEREKLNPRFNIMEKQEPEFFFLRDFEKALIEGEALIVHFKDGKKARIRLESYAPSLLEEIGEYIAQAAQACSGSVKP